MKRRLAILWLAGVLIAAAVIGYLLLRNRSQPAANPVVLIGLDGADWNIIDRLLERGKLPHLAALKREGSWGVLETVHPTMSPVVWTSIATGKTMLKHGILDHSFLAKNNIRVPYSSGERRAKAFWNILGERGFTVGVVNWFASYPADKVNGFLVSDRFRLNVYKKREDEKLTFPPDLGQKIYPLVVTFRQKAYQRILREEGLKDFLADARARSVKIPAGRENEVGNFQSYTLQDKSVENVALYLLKNVSVDVFAAYFRLIDTTSHFCSIFLDEDLRSVWIRENKERGGPSAETEKRLYENMASIIEPVYSYLDNVVGRIISQAPPNATFFLASDHGFNFSPRGYNHYDTPSIPHGIIIVKGPGVKPGHRLERAGIFDVTPTLLWMFGLPVAKDMDGAVLWDAFVEDFGRGKKLRTIASYGAPERKDETKKQRPMDKEILEELRTLGYIK